MANDEKKFSVVVSSSVGSNEFVPDPAIFDGERRVFFKNPPADYDQSVTQAQYEQLKDYKNDSGKQFLVKGGGE